MATTQGIALSFIFSTDIDLVLQNSKPAFMNSLTENKAFVVDSRDIYFVITLSNKKNSNSYNVFFV